MSKFDGRGYGRRGGRGFVLCRCGQAVMEFGTRYATSATLAKRDAFVRQGYIYKTIPAAQLRMNPLGFGCICPALAHMEDAERTQRKT